MIRTNDLQRLRDCMSRIGDYETLDKDSVIDCFDEIFAILLKMSKMKIKEYDYGGGAYITKEAAIDKRFASYISGVGKGISSGKIAPAPKTLPVRRPKENVE